MLTLEQKQLLSDNINIAYKYFAMHKIFDEDVRQDMLLHLCMYFYNYDSSKGALSTYIFTVLHNYSIKLYNKNIANMTDGWNENNLVSIDEPLYTSDDGDIFTYADLIPVEDAYEIVDARDAYHKILNEYKFRYPFTWERDIKIFNFFAEGSDKLRNCKAEFGISHQACSLIIGKIKKFFNDHLNGKVKPIQFRTDLSDKIFYKDKKSNLTDKEFTILLSWIYNTIETKKIKDRGCKIVSSTELAELLSNILNFNIISGDIKKAMYYCNNDAIEDKNHHLIDIEWYYILTKSNKIFNYKNKEA